MPPDGEGADKWRRLGGFVLDDLGDGPGFRKVRGPLGVTAFGVNAIVLPPGSRPALHERQEEPTSCSTGEIEFELDGTTHTLGPGGLARVAPATMRSLRNTSDSAEATYFCVGGADGYVGRDG